jgi:hypothetical protein
MDIKKTIINGILITNLFLPIFELKDSEKYPIHEHTHEQYSTFPQGSSDIMVQTTNLGSPDISTSFNI